MNKVFFGHTDTNGKVLIDWKSIQEWAGRLRGDIQVLVGKRVRQRTLDANALYWLWLGVIEGETGQDKNSLHDFFKSRFLKRTKEVFGKVYEVVESSAIQDTISFADYMKRVRQFALEELRITLPDTND